MEEAWDKEEEELVLNSPQLVPAKKNTRNGLCQSVVRILYLSAQNCVQLSSLRPLSRACQTLLNTLTFTFWTPNHPASMGNGIPGGVPKASLLS